MRKYGFDECGFFMGEDSTCYITCSCGNPNDFIVSDYELTRCPVCGRGYKVEFIVWQYEKDENELESLSTVVPVKIVTKPTFYSSEES